MGDEPDQARWVLPITATILSLEVEAPYGPFLPVTTANGVSLDFMTSDQDEITSQHYAFLVSEEDFDAIFQRIQRAGITYYAELPGDLPVGPSEWAVHPGRSTASLVPL